MKYRYKGDWFSETLGESDENQHFTKEEIMSHFEEVVEPKKIEQIDQDYYFRKNSSGITNEEALREKINQIIDVVNELQEKIK